MTDGPLSCRTPPARAVNAYGWVECSGVLVTPVPLLDSETWLCARLTYDDAVQVAAREGAQLLTAALVESVYHASAFKLRPVLLPPTAAMLSRGHARDHDAACWLQLGSLDWRGQAVANFGKDWIQPSPPGRATNFGWLGEGPYRTPSGGRCWQPVGRAHDSAGHFDYSQTLRLWRPIA